MKTVVGIGIFDGFHKGHQQIVKKIVDKAKRLKCKSVIFTFDPHPVNVHSGEKTVHLLYSLGKRVEFLKKAGVDQVHILNYTLAFAKQLPEEFVEKYFIKIANACVVVAGEDMRFGRNNSAGIVELKEFGKKYGFEVETVKNINFENQRYSSTIIRQLLNDGEVEKASQYLGRDFELFSTVVHGFKNGRKIGYPTANLDIKNLDFIPKEGVYAGILTCENVSYPCAISVGMNYQFDAENKSVEAHVLGRGDLNFYDKQVGVKFIKYLRPMMKFDSLDGLLMQMEKDVCECAEILGVPKPDRIDPATVLPASVI